MTTNKNIDQRNAVQNYVDYLADARTNFEAALTALSERAFSSEIANPAQIAAHKIAGNALMYGYPGLGDRAREFENFLQQSTDKLDMALGQSLCIKLLARIDEIRSHAKIPETPEFESDSFHQDPTSNRWKDGSIETEGYGNTGHRPSVLLIHSDPWMRDLMTNMLGADYDVKTCEQAHEAMASSVNDAPDLIITEQQLPDMSGIDMTRFIRSVNELDQLPIVMIMNSNDPKDIVEAVQAGVTDCFENALEVLPLINHAKELLKKTRFHVFIVDDDAAVRDLLQQRFEVYGVRVDTASDGIEALEYLRNKRPDLIILDRMMPRLEGGAVLYQIQQEVNLKSIPVMLVTAMTNRDDVITWLKRGATDYITKPFNPDEVVLRALRHLRIEKDAA